MPLRIKVTPASSSSSNSGSEKSLLMKKYRSISCENLNGETGLLYDDGHSTKEANIRRRYGTSSAKKDQAVQYSPQVRLKNISLPSSKSQDHDLRKGSTSSSVSGNTIVEIGPFGGNLATLNRSSSYLHWYYEIACFLCVVPWRPGKGRVSALVIAQWVSVNLC